MNTRFRFQVIAILIGLSLFSLLLSQGYWLRGLYISNKEKTQESIRDAMQMADYKEVFARMDTLSKINYHGEITYNSKVYQDSTEVSKDSTMIQKDTEEEFSEFLLLINNIESELQAAIHQKIDSLMPIFYPEYEKFLTAELQERGITVPFRLEVIRQDFKDSVLYVTPDTVYGAQSWKKTVRIKLPIGGGSDYYSLQIQSPFRIVFQQMAGILVSSLLLVIVILGAFIYLLYTILRQKTVEELKTDFTNNMTHELKTPISVAYAANDVLLNYTQDTSEKQKKYLTIVREQLTHLSGLVEQILTLSVENRSTFRLQPEPIPIARLVSALIEQYKLKAGKPVTFTMDIPADLEIIADRTHLYNMISNLIENALKYSGEKTCVICIKDVSVPGEKRLSISDNGIGISETAQKHIFEKFYRVPSGNLHNVKGYGLGLYYVSDMMAKHGGNITVKSQPGKGSTFTLHFK